jgi:hypothetical protein
LWLNVGACSLISYFYMQGFQYSKSLSMAVILLYDHPFLVNRIKVNTVLNLETAGNHSCMLSMQKQCQQILLQL